MATFPLASSQTWGASGAIARRISATAGSGS
jgi:hypothetical protein